MDKNYNSLMFNKSLVTSGGTEYRKLSEQCPKRANRTKIVTRV